MGKYFKKGRSFYPPNRNASDVYYSDLYSTLTRIFFQEITVKLDNASGEKLSALRQFIEILNKVHSLSLSFALYAIHSL